MDLKSQSLTPDRPTPEPVLLKASAKQNFLKTKVHLLPHVIPFSQERFSETPSHNPSAGTPEKRILYPQHPRNRYIILLHHLKRDPAP